MQVVAQDVTVNLRMVQGLEAHRVWQVMPVIKDLGPGVTQGRAIVIPVGELEKGGAAYLAEIMLPRRPAGLVRIAQTDAAYTLPDGESGRQSVDLIISYSEDPSAVGQLDQYVMNVVEKVQAFKLQTQALDEADRGDVKGATQKLRQAVTILLSHLSR
jgi:Ca-activated chloride channel family protein